jgi:hypothetical protein
LPNTYPTYKDWHGEWQYSGGSYVPTPDYSAPVTPTTAPTTEQALPGKTHEKEKKKKSPPPPPQPPPPPPPPATTTEPPPEP